MGSVAFHPLSGYTGATTSIVYGSSAIVGAVSSDEVTATGTLTVPLTDDRIVRVVLSGTTATLKKGAVLPMTSGGASKVEYVEAAAGGDRLWRSVAGSITILYFDPTNERVRFRFDDVRLDAVDNAAGSVVLDGGFTLDHPTP